MFFFKHIKAHFYKMMASYLKWVHIGIPLLGIFLFLCYFKIRPSISNTQRSLWYVQALSSAFPLVIAIVTAILYEFDEHAGGCQMILTIPLKRYLGHVSNVIALLMMGAMAIFVAVFGFYMGLYFLFGEPFVLRDAISLSLILFISNVALYLLTYICLYTFGLYAGLGFGVVGSLCSALFILPLGNGLWAYVPFSYAIRLSCGYLYESLQGALTNELAYCENVSAGLKIVFIMTILIGFSFAIWAQTWQNKSMIDA